MFGFLIRGKYARAFYRKYIFEAPDKNYRKNISKIYAERFPDLERLAKKFCKDGMLKLEGYVDEKTLEEMRKDFDRLAANPDCQRYEDTKEVVVPAKLMQESLLFSRMALDPFLLALANIYWGKQVRLVQSIGLRYEPFETEDYGPNQWHHDAKGKQVKIYVLMTDLDENGQCVQIIPKSQGHLKFTTSYEASRYTKGEALKFGEPVQLTGKAGTILIFDTDCLHRATRRNTYRRDIWNFTYHYIDNAHRTKVCFNQGALEQLDDMQKYASFQDN